MFDVSILILMDLVLLRAEETTILLASEYVSILILMDLVLLHELKDLSAKIEGLFQSLF